MRSTKNHLSDVKPGAKRNSCIFKNSKFSIFFTDEAHLGRLQIDNHQNSSDTSQLTPKTSQTHHKSLKQTKFTKNMSSWQRIGGTFG